MIKRLAHVSVVARDLGETERFYCGTLGLKKQFDFTKNGERIGFYVEVGPLHFIEVFQGEPGATEGRIRHFCLEVDHLDPLRQRLLDSGVAVTDKTQGCDHCWQAWIKDPNGVDIELHEYTPQSLQLRGGTAKVE